MKYSLLIFLFAFLSFSFYQNENPENYIDPIITNDSCLLDNIIITTSNDTATIDTSTFVFSYNKDQKRKRIDCYLENEIYIYVIYEYDKRGRIRAITDNFVLKIDYNGYSKGDIADKIQKRFSYKKGAKFPKHVKRLFGSVGQRGIRNTQLEFKAKSSFEFNDKGQLFRILKNILTPNISTSS